MAESGQSAEELFRAGNLRDALEAQNARVRKSPLDQDARYHLIVLLCYAGELERADKQLAVLAEQDDRMQSGSVLHHALLSSEWERRKVYEEGGRPTLPPDAPAFAAMRADALELLRSGDVDGATSRLEEAVDATPACSGKLGGESFSDIRDYDDVLGSVIEIFAGGRYIWMPISSIEQLSFEEPQTAIDTLWRPAKLRDSQGEQADVHVPVLYAPSYAHERDAIRLGRLTDWREQGDLYTGLGQHLFLTVRGGDRFEHSLMDFRQLEVDAKG